MLRPFLQRLCHTFDPTARCQLSSKPAGGSLGNPESLLARCAGPGSGLPGQWQPALRLVPRESNSARISRHCIYIHIYIYTDEYIYIYIFTYIYYDTIYQTIYAVAYVFAYMDMYVHIISLSLSFSRSLFPSLWSLIYFVHCVFMHLFIYDSLY